MGLPLLSVVLHGPRFTLFPECDEISSSSSIPLPANDRLSAVSLRLTAGSDRQPGGWSAPATLDSPVGVASTTTLWHHNNQIEAVPDI